jgi:hypothetical protein
MKKSRLYACELKRHRVVSPPLCAICPRVKKCRSFRAWYRTHKKEYQDFVLGICRKFPDKYTMEVSFMAEKQTFVQIVDMATGKIDRIVNLNEIKAMTPEEKLDLSRNKNLFIVTYRLEPIVQVQLKRSPVSEPMEFAGKSAPKEEPIEEVTKEPIPTGKAKSKKKK